MNDSTHLRRRDFLRAASLAAAASSFPVSLTAATSEAPGDGFDPLVRGLLRDWCDAMLRNQIDKPGDPKEHGALGCPACGFIHGRCMDAVYPFLHLAKTSGDERYLRAGIAVFEWSRNVTLENGAWTVMPDPKSWTGITIFGAIALAETLHHHGDLLDAATKERWTERLRKAANFIHGTFTLDFTNINYGATAIHGLYLLGKLLGDDSYLKHSRELAAGIRDHLTSPNRLLFGEGKPAKKSPRGMLPVDLGYNMEESFNSLAMYAIDAGDKDLLALVKDSLASHLEFMLPDGAWDNSWGTRQAKWTYWGSRTSDGCQPGMAAMASIVPACGAAAFHNTRLLKACTHGGLLHGGPHYASHGLKPCIHHTFAHAKALASVIDRGLTGIPTSATLPRAAADGIRAFPEVGVHLAARGPWRATVSATDWIYKPKIYQATGGSMAVLWHQAAGPLLAASMADYVMVEPYNMQPNPEKPDFPLTLRIEARENGGWFTNLHDLAAVVTGTDEGGTLHFKVAARLLDQDRKSPPSGPAEIALEYRIDGASTVIRAFRRGAATHHASLVIPVISPTGETVRRVNERRIEIVKPAGTLVIASNSPLRVEPTERDRTFNVVPGFEAVPLAADLTDDPAAPLEIRITFAERMDSRK